MARLDYMEVAKYLYNKTLRMSNLKLQKMMFFAYVEYYEKYREELFQDDFEAWVYGPVLPKLYYYFYQLLLDKEYDEDSIKDKKIRAVLDNVIEKYGKKDAFELVKISHNDDLWKNKRAELDPSMRSNRKLNIKVQLQEKNKKNN